jgi:Holliday junction resolvasome RuvABC endonuclease subunit
MTSVVGLDLSLTSTGVATATRTWRLKPKAVKQTDPPAMRVARHRRLRSSIVEILAEVMPTHVVIEGPAHAASGGHEHERGGFWWSVIDVVDRAGIDILVATPQMIKKYATGRGNADKDEVLSATVRRFDWFTGGNDEADALWACALGYEYFDLPILELPKAHVEALKSWRQADTGRVP